MALKKTMYKGVANSPETTITNNINETDTLIYVLDETRIPAELPNLMVLGTGTGAETIKVLSIEGNAITVERGFQGVAKAWNTGTVIARNFTEYDYNALKENIKGLDEDLSDLTGEGRTTENVKENADNIGPLASLITRIKTNIVNAINGLQEDHNTHLAKDATISTKGHVKLGTAAGTAAEGNHNHDSVYGKKDGTLQTNLNAEKIGGYKVWVGTQAEYDAIGAKDTNTLYFVK